MERVPGLEQVGAAAGCAAPCRGSMGTRHRCWSCGTTRPPWGLAPSWPCTAAACPAGRCRTPCAVAGPWSRFAAASPSRPCPRAAPRSLRCKGVSALRTRAGPTGGCRAAAGSDFPGRTLLLQLGRGRGVGPVQPRGPCGGCAGSAGAVPGLATARGRCRYGLYRVGVPRPAPPRRVPRPAAVRRTRRLRPPRMRVSPRTRGVGARVGLPRDPSVRGWVPPGRWPWSFPAAPGRWPWGSGPELGATGVSLERSSSVSRGSRARRQSPWQPTG